LSGVIRSGIGFFDMKLFDGMEKCSLIIRMITSVLLLNA
jgi:hypothetical protein